MPAAPVHLPRPRPPGQHVLVSVCRAGVARPGREPLGAEPGGAVMSALAPTLQAFFTDRLARQRHASPETVAAYRDGLRLLVGFASHQVRKQPSQLDVADLDAPLIADRSEE